MTARISRIALALALCFLAATAPAQVLKQVPENAFAVAKFNNLQATSRKLADFYRKLGVDKLDPAFADPLASIQQATGITAGLDLNGELAFAILPNSDPEDDSPWLLVLIPVSDYKAFLTNFKEPHADGAISTINIDSDEFYCTQWGAYAALSPDKETLTHSKPGGLVIPDTTAKELATKDATLYANPKALAKLALPHLTKEGREDLLKDIISELTDPDDPANKDQVALIRTVANTLLDFARQTLTDATGAAISVHLNDAGVQYSALVEFAPDSPLGNFTRSIRTSDKSMLEGLPAGQYLLYGGYITDPTVSQKLANEVLPPILKDLPALGEPGAALQKMVEAYRDYWLAVESESFAADLSMDPNAGGIRIASAIRSHPGKARDVVDALNRTAEWENKVSHFFPEEGLEETLETTDNARTIDGVTFDRQRHGFKFDQADLDNDPETRQLLDRVFGKAGNPYTLDLHVGVSADDRALWAVGDDALLQSLITSTRKNDAPLAELPHVKQVAAQLPRQRFFTFYVAGDRAFDLVMTVMNEMGMPMKPIKLPPGTPPLGFAASTDGATLRFDTHVPMGLIERGMSAALQIKMQMEGNPGGGAGLGAGVGN